MEKKKRNFSQRPAWHRHFHGETLRREIKLTLPARGLLAGLKDLMFAEQGPVENDLESIGRSLGIRDKRTVTKALQELTDKGFIVVTEDGLVHEDSMREIVENSALFAAHGMTGGRPAKKNGQDEFDMSSASDRELIANCSETDTSQPIENIENTEKPGDTIEQKKIKTSPLPPKQDRNPGVMNGHVNGGGGGPEIEFLIEEHFRIAAGLWGESAVKSSRRNCHHKNVTLAGEWLGLAGGSVDVVVQAMTDALTNRRVKDMSVPGTLGACGLSIPDHIATAMKPFTLTATSSGPNVPKAAAGPEPEYIAIRSMAQSNGWTEEALRIRELGKKDPAAAEAYAISVRETVKSKKARAA